VGIPNPIPTNIYIPDIVTLTRLGTSPTERRLRASSSSSSPLDVLTKLEKTYVQVDKNFYGKESGLTYTLAFTLLSNLDIPIQTFVDGVTVGPPVHLAQVGIYFNSFFFANYNVTSVESVFQLTLSECTSDIHDVEY